MRLALWLLVVPLAIAARPAPATSPPDEPAMVGAWTLDRGRTRYGPGVSARRWEEFTCRLRGARLACEIVGEHVDGRVVRARFAAPLDGTGAPVTGIADLDEVRLTNGPPGVTDATFLQHGTPRFGYRAFRATDGRSLTIVSVDPVTRAALSTVVVYGRRAAARSPSTPTRRTPP